MMLSEISRVNELTSPIYAPLMTAHFTILHGLLKPGTTMMNWTSLTVDGYVDNVMTFVRQMELIISRCDDLRKYRIEKVTSS